MDKREIKILKCIFFSSFFLFGLFKEYGACIYTGLYGGYLLWQGRKKRKQPFFLNADSGAILAIAGCTLLTCFYGVDRGMSFIGFLRILGVVFFLCIVMELTEKEKKELLHLVPAAAAVMTAAGWAARLWKPVYDFFYVADRLGGFFQYPNVYALFCLLGMILLVRQQEAGKKRWQHWGELLLLLSGILLSGSRTVFFLMLFAMAVLAAKNKRLRLPFVLTVAGIVAAGLLYGAVTGNMQNISRFLTTSLSASTLLGRVLYAKDGLRLLASHPFGLGYLGYSYMEPEIQTAFYSVRFIHNDFLQLALDAGILPGALFLLMFIRNVFNRRLPWENRLLLAVMGLHFLMDFDLEFVSIWYLFLLLPDFRYGKEKTAALKSCRLGVGAAVGLLTAAALYTGGAMVPRYLGNPELSLSLLPFYTESGRDVLKKEKDPEKGQSLAERIKKQNPYVPEAYDILAVKALQEGNYREMTDNKKKSLSLQRYHAEAYERYLALISQGLAAESRASAPDMEKIDLLLDAALEIPALLSETEKNTDPLAWKTRDVPKLALSSEAQKYLSQLKAVRE